MILVGRPGLGKTPPLNFAYRPIQDHDAMLLKKYLNDLSEYEKAKALAKENVDIPKPILQKTLLRDFTTEQMFYTHANNPRGIAIVTDEIQSLFKSTTRYNNADPLIEHLLSAYSGITLDSSRKSESRPTIISVPCINIVGNIQTKLMNKIATGEYLHNGFWDRFLFSFPLYTKIPHWEKNVDLSYSTNLSVTWKLIIDKILNLSCNIDPLTNIVQPKILELTDEAGDFFIDWNNKIIDNVNSIEDDNDIQTRDTKLNGNAGKLAIVLQILRWACCEGEKDCIDITSMVGATKLIDYFEDCFERLKNTLNLNSPISNKGEKWLYLLPNTFEAKEAIKIGEKVGLKERQIYYYLKKLSSGDKAVLDNYEHGKYRKILTQDCNCSMQYCSIAGNNTQNPQDNMQICNTANCNHAGNNTQNPQNNLQICNTANCNHATKDSSTIDWNRFHLQKYSHGSKINCPSCGKKKCFTKYIDDYGEVVFPDNVGYCDHINSCAYNYTPGQYFKDNPEILKGIINNSIPLSLRQSNREKVITKEPISYIEEDIVNKSLSHYDINPLFKYLSNIFGIEETRTLFSLYKVGTSKKWGGTTIYWQTDIFLKVRTGKIMRYDVATGHRVKDGTPAITWVHTELNKENYNLKQCFFGEHLLADKERLIGIVESEKTALICHLLKPKYIWIASGGINGCFKEETCQVLKDRKVTLYPDLGAFKAWEEKVPMLEKICQSVKINDYIDRIATDEDRRNGLDIADFLLKEITPQKLLEQRMERNPILKKLVTDLDLVIDEKVKGIQLKMD